MALQSPFGSQPNALAAMATRGDGASRMASSRPRSEQLIESLAGGLRTTYQAEPETEIPDAFAELIARLHTAESRAR